MLPFIETKQKSTVNFSGEVAALIPSTTTKQLILRKKMATLMTLKEVKAL